jgi:hypothetical protein
LPVTVYNRHSQPNPQNPVPTSSAGPSPRSPGVWQRPRRTVLVVLGLLALMLICSAFISAPVWIREESRVIITAPGSLIYRMPNGDVVIRQYWREELEWRLDE